MIAGKLPHTSPHINERRFIRRCEAAEAISGHGCVAPDAHSMPLGNLVRCGSNPAKGSRPYGTVSVQKRPRPHEASFRSSARVGSSIWKIDPFPSVDSTQIRPPCISTICLAMARPRPVPLLALVLELST
jgi:hypothetical protein